eukprot:2063476-Pleurochrysis_carterae.AAC.2
MPLVEGANLNGTAFGDRSSYGSIAYIGRIRPAYHVGNLLGRSTQHHPRGTALSLRCQNTQCS